MGFNAREYIMNNSSSKNFDNNHFENKLINLKIFHKILDFLNISSLISILTLSFISFNSQRLWTNYYSNLIQIRTFNNDLIDNISRTESYYLGNIEKHDNFKKTTSKDLIYFYQLPRISKQALLPYIFDNLRRGWIDSKFQRGY